MHKLKNSKDVKKENKEAELDNRPLLYFQV